MELNQQQMRAFFHSGKTLSYAYRIEALEKLKRALSTYEAALLDAVYQDFGKAPFETYMTELLMVSEELDYMLKHLRQLMKPQKVATPLLHMKSSSRIYHEPYGIVLLISPWNYPITLSLVPLMGAIAAGNCVVMKPSSKSWHTTEVLAELIASIYPEDYVTLLRGPSSIVYEVIENGVDYILFTGSPEVGQKILKAASSSLTPVLLELGGKSPAVVFADANLEKAGARLIWGKVVNAGQTCIAPDYVLVEETMAEKLMEHMMWAIERYYGKEPLESPDLPSIINTENYERVKSYLTQGKLIYGGRYDDKRRKIAPTLLLNPDLSSEVMTREIFGPVLPVITFREPEEPVNIIRSRPKPLALYLFTENSQTIDWYMEHMAFGNGCINDTLIQFANAHLPFGGVGHSGMGKYHGKYSLESFSHRKAVSRKTTAFDITFRYPPYTADKLKQLKRFMKWLP